MKHVRIALVLALASTVSAALVFPYLLELTPKLRSAPAPLWLLLLGQTLQAGVLSFVLGWLGLLLGATVGLDSPMLRAWLDRQPQPPQVSGFLPISAGIGLLTGVALTALDWFVFWHRQPEGFRKKALEPSLWAGALAALYGGISEEVLTRLFLTTLLVWILFKLSKRLNAAVFIFAIVVGALVFAAGHLPTAARLAPLTEVVVVRVLVLNGVAGVAFGWLYWKRGLEQAMVAHFCADLVLHVAAPALVR